MKTVKQYISEVNAMGMPEKFTDQLLKLEVWSNEACKGYAIAAGRIIGLEPEKIKDLTTDVEVSLKQLSVQEAEELSADFSKEDK